MVKVVILLGVWSALACNAQAGDPQYQRELERQEKSEHLRHMRMHTAPIVSGVDEVDFLAPKLTVEAYRFDLNVLPAEGKLEGTLTADLIALEKMTEVTFDALDLKITKVWFSDELGVKTEARFEILPSTVRVTLPVALRGGVPTKFSLIFAYSAVGDKRDGRNGGTEHGLFFVNADGARHDVTPTVYTIAEPDLARKWFPCIDNPSYKAAHTEMRITVPSGWTAVSNGALKSKTEHVEAKTITFEWRENFPISPYLISLAIAPYVVIEDHAGALPIQYYVPAELEAKARFDFGRTPQILEYFSKLWVPFPYEKYAMATVPLFGGAIEHTSATTMSDMYITGDRDSEETVAHELAHQWWGDLVTLASWDDLWLNEGFATYAETLYAQQFDGPDAVLNDLIVQRSGYFQFDTDNNVAVVDPKVSLDDKYTPAVYEKGGWVLHMLRQKVGDAAFFNATTAYLKKFAFRNASTQDLIKVFEEVSGMDLSEFFKQWVFGAGYPVLGFSWTHDPLTRTVQVTLEQHGNNFKFPLELLIAGRDEKGAMMTLPFPVEVTAAKQAFTYKLPVNFPNPSGVAVDPKLKVLKKITAVRTLDEVRFWLDAAPELSWLVGHEALDGIDHAAVTIETAREIATRLSREHVEAVQVEMLELLVSAHKIKDFTAADFLLIQKVIRERLMSTNVEVRLAAAAAAQEYLNPELAELISQQFELEPEVRVKARLALTLAHSHHAKAFEQLYAEMQKSNALGGRRKLVQSVLEAFGVLGDRRAAALLADFVSGPNPYFQTVALESLGSLAVPATFQTIANILSDLSRSVESRVSSAKALANYGGISAAKELNDQLKVEKDDIVKKAIKTALEHLGGMPQLRDLSVQGSPALLNW